MVCGSIPEVEDVWPVEGSTPSLPPRGSSRGADRRRLHQRRSACSPLPAGGGRGPRGAVWRVLGASDEGARPTAAGPDGADGAVDPPQVLLTGGVSGHEWGELRAAHGSCRSCCQLRSEA